MARKRAPRRCELPAKDVFAVHAVLRDFDAAFAIVGFAPKPNCKVTSGARGITIRVVWQRKTDGLVETITVAQSGARG